MTSRFRWASEIAALINGNSRIEFLNHTGWSDRPKRFAELTTPARLLLRLRPIGLALRASPLKELGVTHWPARVSNPFAEREFVACADGVFGYELQALQKQFHHKAAEF